MTVLDFKLNLSNISNGQHYNIPLLNIPLMGRSYDRGCFFFHAVSVSQRAHWISSVRLHWSLFGIHSIFEKVVFEKHFLGREKLVGVFAIQTEI